MRVRGHLAALRAAELRVTPAEAEALLSAATGVDLPQAAVSALVTRTEGWAVGLQLAALSLQPARDGSNRPVQLGRHQDLGGVGGPSQHAVAYDRARYSGGANSGAYFGENECCFG
jgi:hypothetical protein